MSKVRFVAKIIEYVVTCFCSYEYCVGVLRGGFCKIFLRRDPKYFTVLGLRLIMPFQCFRSQYKGIFIEREYEFPWSSGEPPRILDLGANYGMGSIFFLSKYPNCKIDAYEADPSICEVLRKNIAVSRYSGTCDIFKSAAWKYDGFLNFSPDGLDGGSINFAKDDSSSLEVECSDLRRILSKGRYDVLKMDIEGAERDILPLVFENLDGIRLVIFEYHSERNKKQNIGLIFAQFEKRGFRLHLRSEDLRISPFDKDDKHGFENRLVVYCYKN